MSLRPPQLTPRRSLLGSLLFLGAALASNTAAARSAQEPDLYDDTVLRTIDISIPSANFWNDLRATANSGLNIVADLTLDGPDLAAPVVIPGIGIRIKGNSSYFFLPAGSQKASFNIEVDHTVPGTRLLGYQTLNLNNGIEDPTFCREVTYLRAIREFTPAGRGNHVVLRLNGQEWGVYANVQQYNSDLLDEYFVESSGARYKAPNVGTSGGALRYLGTNPATYVANYQLKDDGGLMSPWQPMIEGTNALNNSGANVAAIEERFAADAAIWSLVAENLFMDEDSYLSKGADFNVYADPLHGRIHLNQHDGNESWGVSYFGWPAGTTTNLSPTHNFTNSGRPALQRLMAIPALRERYFAHMRTMLEDFTWARFGPQLLAYQALLDAAVQADPKKIYTYAQFQSNFFTQTTIVVNGSALPAPGLQQFVDARGAYLRAHPELNEPVPTLSDLGHAPANPLVGTQVFVTARAAAPAGLLVDHVTLYARAIGRFVSAPMFDDGQHGDGAAGDGLYGAALPVQGPPGGTVQYYVEAGLPTAAGGALVFEPKYAEGRPAEVGFSFGASGIRITEYLYSGSGDEFLELTNTSAAPIDLAGWSLDDDSATPGAYDLSAAGVVAPGGSVVVTDGAAAVFVLEWGLAGVTVLEGNVAASLGRNDAIHVFDAAGVLQDRLVYGDEAFAGSVRARERAAWVCADGVGADDAYAWSPALAGDMQGSWASSTGDVGSPGAWSPAPCGGLGTPYCASNPNSTGVMGELRADGSRVAGANDVTLTASRLPQNAPGIFIVSAAADFVANPGGSVGNVCLAAPIGRYVGAGQVGNSGATGTISLQLDVAAIPQPAGAAQALAGETWRWQLWHRDSAGGQAVSNFTHGLALSFE